MPSFSFFNKCHRPKHTHKKKGRIGQWLIKIVLFSLLLFSAIWLGLLIWFHFGQYPLAWAVLFGLSTLVIAIIRPIKIKWFHKLKSKDKSANAKHSPKKLYLNRRTLVLLYSGIWGAGLLWYLSLVPKADRPWKPEVENILRAERDVNNPNIVTLYNVRNFDWHGNPDKISNKNFKSYNNSSTESDSNKEDNLTAHWNTRQVDLSKLSGVDVVNAYWMGPYIGHTLVTFRFAEDRPLAFSFEIRKEEGENFSTLGGFFKKYELSLIGSEERDIIYTRTNYRGEQTYLFALDNLTQAQVCELFENYLMFANKLNAEPAWYNTLTQNCTNLIFDLARRVDAEKFPLDYRIWLSGYVPNYLNSNDVLANQDQWNMDTWYDKAHINPKVVDFSEQDNLSDTAYSKLIRQGLPIPTLKTGVNK